MSKVSWKTHLPAESFKQKIPLIRTAYDGLDREFSDKTAYRSNLPGLTHQNFKDECDINNIVRNGLPPQDVAPQYFDASEVPDYQTALNQVIAAQNAFAELPSKVRDRFGNDPAKFMQFMHDPSNLDEMVRMGLVELSQKETPVLERAHHAGAKTGGSGPAKAGKKGSKPAPASAGGGDEGDE